MAVIVCPICSTRYRVTDAQLSKASRLKCKKCKTVFPVSDNIKTENFSGQEEAPPSPQDSSFPGTLDFPTQTMPTSSEQPASDNEMTLDMPAPGSESAPAPPMDFSFSAATPEMSEGETNEGDVEIQDHIADTSQTDQGELEIGFGSPSVGDGSAADGESTLSMDGGANRLDFSFSAVTPESAPDHQEDRKEDGERVQEDQNADMQDLSLGLDLGGAPDEATMTMTDTASSLNLDISLEGASEAEGGGEAEDNQESRDDSGYGEPLNTCCVDSLAMGMTTCELCGRDLQGLEDNSLVRERREQLREELPPGEVHIGFSAGEAGSITEADSGADPHAEEDFSDVERALDALADGTFEKEIKKREAKKHRGQRLKMMGLGVAAGLIVVIMIGWMFLPSSHERLVAKHEDLMAKPEVDPEELVTLFLQAAAKQDQEIFRRVSVMPNMPNLTGGSVLSIGENYEQTSLGPLGKDIVDLEAELASLQSRYEQTEQQWQEASAVDLSPSLVFNRIEQLQKKQAALQAEFDEKVQESARKTLSLEAEIKEAEEELEENIRRAQKYIDATDPQGKAIYTASVRNQQSLSDKIGKLEGFLTDERLAHAERMQALEAEYNPQFEKIASDLEIQQALYEKAKLYEDEEKSPLVILDQELKDLKSAINEIEQVLEEKREQLATVFEFFKRPARRQQVEQLRQEAEFVHVSKNVVASVKFRESGKLKVPVVLKRYQAIAGGQTIQGDWVVEAILR